MVLRKLWVLALVVVPWVSCGAAELPAVPDADHFVRDAVALLSAADAEVTNKLCVDLLAEKKLPVAVLTVQSVAEYNAASVEILAARILKSWAELDPTRDWNHGGLILVAKGDRKVRIQLGLAYHHSNDTQSDLIMNTRIVPRFKAGAFSEGIRGGTEAFVQLLRGGTLPLDVQPAEAPISVPEGAAVPPAPERPSDPNDFYWGLGVLVVLLVLFVGLLYLVFYRPARDRALVGVAPVVAIVGPG